MKLRQRDLTPVLRRPVELADRDLTELEKPFYEPIGIYIFRLGSLERKMDEFISELMGIDFHSIGQYPLSEIDFLSKARLFKVFALKKEPQGKDHIDQFFADVETQNTFRNDLVHGSWASTPAQMTEHILLGKKSA